MFQAMLTLIGAILLWYVFKFIKAYMLWRRLANNPKVFPLGPTHWFWGHAKMVSDPGAMLSVVPPTGCKIQVIWVLFLQAVFMIVHPDTAKIILKSSEPKPKDWGEPYHILVEWLGDGLILSEGPKWERNRKLITKAFHFDILKSYMPIFNQVVDRFLSRVWTRSEQGQKYVKIDELLSDATLDAMLRCAFSLETKVQHDSGSSEYVAALRNFVDILYWKLSRPWCMVKFIFKLYPEGREYFKSLHVIDTYARKVIAERKKELQADPNTYTKGKGRQDFLNIILTATDESGVGLTDEELQDEVNTFLFAGHDTTSSALLFEMYCLGKYPAEQEKVYQEIVQVMGDKTDLQWDDLNKLHQMTRFIKESLRLYPPINGVNRKLTRDVDINGVVFPAGFHIGVMLRALHIHPDVWGPDAKEFKPERFEGSKTEMDPFAFVPFSAGPRNCIGQTFAMIEQKVFLSKLLIRYEVKLDPNHEVKQKAGITTRTQTGVLIQLLERNQNIHASENI